MKNPQFAAVAGRLFASLAGYRFFALLRLTQRLAPGVFKDDNVLKSSVVNAAVLCALLSSGSDPNCVTTGGSEQPQTQRQTQTTLAAMIQKYVPKARLPFSAPGRFDIVAQTRDLTLAEENEVFLKVHAPGLAAVETQQVQYASSDMKLRRTPHFPTGGWELLPITYHVDGSASIRVTPRVLGQLVLQMVGRFADGGYTKSEVVLNVQPPEPSPDKLIVGDWGVPSINVPWISAYLKPSGRAYGLTIVASYPNVKDQVDIDPSFASFEVRTANDIRTIELDKSTGRIKPLRVGEALVETTFGGWTNLTCVVVEDHRDPNRRNLHGCKSLVHAGERLGTPIRK